MLVQGLWEFCLNENYTYEGNNIGYKGHPVHLLIYFLIVYSIVYPLESKTTFKQESADRTIYITNIVSIRTDKYARTR